MYVVLVKKKKNPISRRYQNVYFAGNIHYTYYIDNISIKTNRFKINESFHYCDTFESKALMVFC